MLLRIMTHLFLSKMCANVFLLWCFTASISCQLRRANNFFLYKVTPFLRFFLIKKEGRWKFSLLYLYRFLILRSGELCTKKFSISLLLQYTVLFAQPGLAPSSSAVLLLHHRRRPHRSALDHARVGKAGQEEVAAAAAAAAAAVVVLVVEAAAAGGGRGRVVVVTGPGFFYKYNLIIRH